MPIVTGLVSSFTFCFCWMCAECGSPCRQHSGGSVLSLLTSNFRYPLPLLCLACRDRRPAQREGHAASRSGSALCPPPCPAPCWHVGRCRSDLSLRVAPGPSAVPPAACRLQPPPGGHAAGRQRRAARGCCWRGRCAGAVVRRRKVQVGREPGPAAAPDSLLLRCDGMTTRLKGGAVPRCLSLCSWRWTAGPGFAQGARSNPCPQVPGALLCRSRALPRHLPAPAALRLAAAAGHGGSGSRQRRSRHSWHSGHSIRAAHSPAWRPSRPAAATKPAKARGHQGARRALLGAVQPASFVACRAAASDAEPKPACPQLLLLPRWLCGA